MKTLMDKMDGIEQTLQQKLVKRLFSEHDFVSTAVEEEMQMLNRLQLLQRQQLYFFVTTKTLPLFFIST